MNGRREEIPRVDLMLLTLIGAGLGVTIGQAFDRLWVELLLAVIGAAVVFGTLFRGRPRRGRPVPPRMAVLLGLIAAAALVVVLFLPYGDVDRNAITQAALAGIATALLLAVLGAVRLRRERRTGSEQRDR